jgi:hypothetical protein
VVEAFKRNSKKRGEEKMSPEIEITVENKLITEKRDLNVYHYSTHSAHIISYSSSITLPLGKDTKNDYLNISVVKNPGYLEKSCVINVPEWADYNFICKEGLSAFSINRFYESNGARIYIKIPPGPPVWELKITIPADWYPNIPVSKKKDHVVIVDE